MITKWLTTAFGRSDGTQWVFMSGLVLGLAGNLLISGLAPAPPPSNADCLIIVGICFVGASVCFSLVGWMLQQFEYLARDQASSSAKVHYDVKQRLILASLTRLLAVISLGLILTLLGIVILVAQRGGGQ